MKTLEDVETGTNTGKGDKKDKVESLPAKILTNMRRLHKFPDNPIKVEAINVYSTRWRVNVWTWGENNAKVEASWFVVSDSKGTIISVN